MKCKLQKLVRTILLTKASVALMIGVTGFNSPAYAQVASEVVYQTGGQCLEYVADAQNNYISDYSYAGYRNGEASPPNVPTVMRISPVAGDNTQHIQNALNRMASRPLNANGVRGALLLEAGVYTVSGALFQRASGVVVRGVGDGSDSATNTIIRSTSTAPFTDRLSVITIGNLNGLGAWRDALPNSSTNITSPFLPAGTRTLEVEDVNLFSVGDDIAVVHPSTMPWLASINFGDVGSDEPWQPGELDMEYVRTITAINRRENKITLDVPIYDHFDRELSQAFVHRYDKSQIRTNVGIESLRIDIQARNSTDENHAYTAVRFVAVEDAWARDVTALRFSFAGFSTRAANRVSILDSRALVPSSQTTGGRRYNFNVESRSNNILYQRVRGTNGRHTFVSNGASTAAGIVFHDSVAERSLVASEGHRRWSQGLLYDNVSYTDSRQSNRSDFDVGLYNRGSFGTGHGWSATNSIIWNNEPEDGYYVQNPPRRLNYAIGNRGRISRTGGLGFVELDGQVPLISSLYETQLNSRLANPGVPDAPAKLSARQAGSDSVRLRWLDIAANEGGYRIEFRPNNGAAYQTVATVAANTTEFVHRLSGANMNRVSYRISAMDSQSSCVSGYSNPVAVGQGSTPGFSDSGPGALPNAVVADAFVRDGGFSGDNFGDDQALTVRGQTTDGFNRRAYLRLDLGTLGTRVSSAGLRLRVRSNNGSGGTLHVLHVVDDSGWTEDSVSFNNAPALLNFIQSSTVPSAGGTVEFDITDAVNNRLSAGERFLSFRVANAQNNSNDAFVNYHSTEATNAADRPVFTADGNVVSTPGAGSGQLNIDATYVRDGQFSDDNFGSDTSLVVKGQTTAGFQRQGLLRIDVSRVSADVSNAKLVLTVRGNNRSGGTRHVLHVVSDSWAEDSVDFNSRPSLTSFITSFDVPRVSDTVELDITNAINEARARGLGVLSMRVANAQNGSNDAFVSYHSDDATNVNLRPRVEGDIPGGGTAGGATLTEFPTQDAFVRGGRFSGDNFGNQPTLVVKGQSSPNFQRISYMSFATSRLAGSVADATLRLRVRTNNASGGTRHVVHTVDDDSWRENSITFSSRPGIDSFLQIGSVPAVGGVIEFDVTDAVNNAVSNGDTRIHFRIANAQNGSNDAFVEYHSSEVSDSNIRPRLIINR